MVKPRSQVCNGDWTRAYQRCSDSPPEEAEILKKEINVNVQDWWPVGERKGMIDR